MLQNIIVVIIMLVALGYTFRSVLRSLKSKKSSKCNGCSGCELKNTINKPYHHSNC